jgi:flagellar hook assembly protein FlgD
LSYDKAETIQLHFTSNPVYTPATSNNIVVSAAGPSKLAIQTQPSPTAIVGVAFSIQPLIRIEDAYGNLISADNTTQVTAAVVSGTGTLSGTTTITASGGTATFTNLRYNKAETIQLQFTSSPVYTPATSDNIILSAGNATRLVIETQPSPTATAGTAFASQPIIRIEDNAGNLISTDNTTQVTAAVVSGTGTLSGVTKVTASGGIVTFTDLSYDKAETIQLEFTSNIPLTPVTSDNIVVSAAGPSKLAVQTQPSTTATAGSQLGTQPVIHIEDAYGNLITGDNTTIVTAAAVGGIGTLSGLTTATASGGVATFTNLSYNKAETIHLEFTSNPVYTPASSNNIVVSAAGASKLTIHTQPSPTATSGSPFGTQPLIHIEDLYGNLISGDNSTVVTAAAVGGTGTLSGLTTATASGGVATFTNLNYNKAETIHLEFTSNPVYTPASSNDIVVSAGAVASFTISTISTPQRVGTAFSITITAYDGSANVVTSYAGPANLTISSGSLTPITTGSFTNGAWTDLVTVNQAGTGLSISVDDGSGHTGTSNGFTVLAAPSLYVSIDPDAQTSGIVLPRDSWASTGYENNDWNWTGGQVVSFFLVPETGTIFNGCNVTLTWDATKATLATVAFDSSGTTKDLFGSGQGYAVTTTSTPGSNFVVIQASRNDGFNLTTVAGSYIARVDFVIGNPGHTDVTMTVNSFSRVAPPTPMLVSPVKGEIKVYLGDVVTTSNDQTTGDGIIDGSDLNLWAGSYWSGVSTPPGMANYKVKYDIGPTSDNSVFAHPTVDGKIEFEDLIIFSIAYGQNKSGGYPKISNTSSDTVQIYMGAPSIVGKETRIPLMLAGSARDIRGMKLEFKGTFGTFLGAEKGALLKDYDTPVMLLSRASEGTVFVDCSVFDLGVDAIGPPGELAVLRFEGTPHLTMKTIVARNSYNNDLKIEHLKGAGESTPNDYRLSQNYPNPFNPSTTIEYEIVQPGMVMLEVYNALGEKIATLVNETKDSGFYSTQWNGRDGNQMPVGSGVYFCRIHSGNFSKVIKMLLLK